MTSVAMTFFQFKDNETKQSVYVQVYDDDVDDNGETMHLRAHIHRVKGLDWHDRPPPRRTTGTGTIYNKVEVTVSINDATATEGADVTMDFVVTLSRATSETVTVEYLTSDVTADAKKNGMTQRKIQYWVIPPQADAEFVAHMEQVLDLYQKPYDPDCPVVCMDEQPVQLVKETRPPMAATKNRPRRVDYEYERAGTAAVFLFSEPLAGWRQATARARRTKVDWALEVAGLLEGRYADCEKITLVCDHLNTHTKGAFYQVFEPARARELVRRIEFCHTPKHGSWLNIAENELSSMTRQCVRGRRIGDLGTLHDEVSAWSTDVNGTQRGVDWQMKVDDARCKLKSVYPNIMK